MRQPTAGEPVKLRSLKRESVTNWFPFFRFMGKMLKLPFGKSVLSIMRAKANVDKGVLVDGLSTIGQPAAKAGAIL